MKISILLPAKNAAAWVRETVESVQAQTYKDWEILAVDDHSADETSVILSTLSAEDHRIQLFRNKGQGIIPALQLALEQATGEFITRMDADDLMPVHRLQLFVDALLQGGKGVVVTGKVRYFPEPVSPGYQKYAEWLNARVELNDHAHHIYRECVLASPNWMLHRSDVQEHRLFENLNYPEDYDLVFHMHAAGLQFVGIPQETLLWREHPLRTSRNSEIYQQTSFFELKLKWFLHLQMHPQLPLALFGAGTKGKMVARFLLDHQLDFQWYDLKFEKYSAGIFGKTILPPEEAREAHAIICIYPEQIEALESYLQRMGYTPGVNAWYF